MNIDRDADGGITNGGKRLLLSFLPLKEANPRLILFRMPVAGKYGEFDLPIYWLNDEEGKDLQYYVSWYPRAGFAEFEFEFTKNISLANRVLSELLTLSAGASLNENQYVLFGKFNKKVARIIKSFPEGSQQVVIEPYFVAEVTQFGFLIDFKFKKSPDTKNFRRVLQLSLSLDQRFRKNEDHYLQRMEIIRNQLPLISKDLFPLKTFDLCSSFEAQSEFLSLPYDLLPPKRFIVGSGHEVDNAYRGIKDFGPYKQIGFEPKYTFLFEQENQDLARLLVRALRGELYPGVFIGLQKFFRTPFENSQINKVPLGEDIPETVDRVCDENSKGTVAIALLRKGGPQYSTFKHSCLRHNLPEQVVTPELIRQKESLKWSTSNIALGLFAKLGGVPWLLKAPDSRRLIVGIGQAHKSSKVDEKWEIRKYFSYSVLTESSGLYKDIDILGNSDDKAGYLNQLSEKLTTVLQENLDAYDSFALHVPFKIKRDEIMSIKAAVDRTIGTGTQKEFVVLRVNVENKFFAYNPMVNSLLPYAGTVAKISEREYLAWFNGLDREGPRLSKYVGGPIYISFEHPSSNLDEKRRMSYVEDLNNLAAANWRGFNGKSEPISIFYCELIAGFLKRFSEEGLNEVSFDHFKPWFL